MPGIVILGSQWGDEGKGKATDLLGKKIDCVVKFNGGNNAGHTVVIGSERYALHLLPTGILTPGVLAVIGNGAVVDLEVLFEEIYHLEARGIDTSCLRVSASAHVIPRYNKILDSLTDRYLGKVKIGTTGRGIGPTYADKMARAGIRVQDLFDESILRQKVEYILEIKNELLTKTYASAPLDAGILIDELLSYADRLRSMVVDSGLLLYDLLSAGKTVVFEGGQATMLDIDHGTYPYVTSSSACAGGAATGSGVPPSMIDKTIGVTKAYTTRVGEGPFPSEIFGEEAIDLRERGGEYGTTTQRPRRVGWYDCVVARYAARINGFTYTVLTKLDVLSGMEKIPVCVSYEVDGTKTESMPMTQTEFYHAKPVYVYFDGWEECIEGARSFADLPQKAKEYVLALEEMSDTRICAIGTGPRRSDIIERYSIL